MSINYIGILNGGLSIDKEGNASTTRILVYYFNDGESPVDIIAEDEIPEIGEAHPSDSTYLATNISVSEPQEGDEKKSGKYEVTITYTRTAANIIRDQTQEPWKMKPYDLSIAPLEIVVPFVKAYKNGDKNGSPSEPVLNPAGDPYEEGVSIQHTLLRFSYNLQVFSDSWLDSYIDSVNKINTKVCNVSIQAGKGRIRNLTGSQQYVYNTDGSVKYEYWKVDIEIEIAKKVWKKEIMARGLFFLSGGKKYPMRAISERKKTWVMMLFQ